MLCGTMGANKWNKNQRIVSKNVSQVWQLQQVSGGYITLQLLSNSKIQTFLTPLEMFQNRKRKLRILKFLAQLEKLFFLPIDSCKERYGINLDEWYNIEFRMSFKVALNSQREVIRWKLKVKIKMIWRRKYLNYQSLSVVERVVQNKIEKIYNQSF